MTVVTANGSGTGRWSLLKKLGSVFKEPNRQAKPSKADDAYNDYWKVRSHRSPSTAGTARK